MIKLRISDEDLSKLTDGCWIGPEHVRAGIESAGIEAPAVTVEELAEVMRDALGTSITVLVDEAARAVLELMRGRVVPMHLPPMPGSQWVDLARVSDPELAAGPFACALDDLEAEVYGTEFRAWLLEKCGGGR